MGKRVAILADSISNKGGVERVILAQAKALNADIYVGRYGKSTFQEFKEFKVVELVNKRWPGKLSTIQTWIMFSKLRLKYDLYIIHGAGALNVARSLKPNIWYCHSPSRYLYDLYEREFKNVRGLTRLIYPFVTFLMRRRDQNNVKQVNKIVVNSENIKNRVKKYYSRKSEVVYPFVNINNYKFINKGDFFLSTSRLDPIKRVHLVINAFKQMPDKNLVIVSDGPDRKKLEKLAGFAKNIKFLGYVSEKKLQVLYGECLATIYLSYKEDFGLVPVESMAAGKPCIATKEGGFKETILHKKTGYLVDDPTNIEEVIEAVNWIEKNAKIMRKPCEQRARIFSLETSMKKFMKIIEELK